MSPELTRFVISYSYDEAALNVPPDGFWVSCLAQCSLLMKQVRAMSNAAIFLIDNLICAAF